jgi:hypothetical protein
MAVGLPAKTTYADGDVFSASDINDTNGTLNLVGQTTNFYAGKNKIINGDFRINQRNFTSTATNGIFGFDRWKNQMGSSGTSTFTPETFTPGAAPVAGYEGSTFAQIVSASQAGAGDYSGLNQNIEDVRTFAGQTVTISFWAKADSGTPKVGVTLEQAFGSGGSASTYTSATASTISTSWARYSVNITLPSLTGKTIGTSSFVGLYLFNSTGSTATSIGFSDTGLQNGTFQYWGVQIEAGSTATAFQTASGSFQGELALCQRYYQRSTAPSAYSNYCIAFVRSATNVTGVYNLPVTMRAAPTSIDYSTICIYTYSGAIIALSVVVLEFANTNSVSLLGTITGGTANDTGQLLSNNSTSSFLGFSAEL